MSQPIFQKTYNLNIQLKSIKSELFQNENIRFLSTNQKFQLEELNKKLKCSQAIVGLNQNNEVCAIFKLRNLINGIYLWISNEWSQCDWMDPVTYSNYHNEFMFYHIQSSKQGVSREFFVRECHSLNLK
ncbi:hypothetical protein ENU1_087690 [Entamoeba nuttalli P19]|uniref:Uncharacterized protein n=1 Tax=Entamoeba nuttalli (strain P19) TaxID=1076696 RepID=K2H2H8_ENTNP|nr:hypothetical protein ENU1_087690 [Entamoeba nuttalli P19]EKE40527.1 hypothetical protein ENU1_087690 [Entamoeba nuttalli P19]|eukprot:XP_008857140.1 hypothetical protein ENU1_087690 [Entamoeba nuttalli P19]